MARLNRGTMIASTLMLIAVLMSGCSRSASTPPPETESFFTTPFAETPADLSDVAAFGTGTALALTGTPQTGLATQTPSTPLGITPQSTPASVTPTPLVSINPTSTATATLAVNRTQSGPLPTSVPVGSRPSTYTLQSGEFPYCIARRFDVDPDALLSLNGLSDGVMYPAGTALRIPQSGSFPGTRALRNHPATYTVATSDETVYSIACLFGDVDPSAIAQANNISPGAALSAGQQLSIP
ncbi:MAG: LysM peptidoglycan-binding domain-containing protein [Anaerolineales bacterium]